MTHRMTRLLLALLLAAFARPAWAWNEVGHLTIARIAWEQLDATQREAVTSVLRQHPHCEQLLLKDRPQEATPEEWMFLRAASWADYIRPPRNLPRNEISTHPVHRFHRGPWHYVNFPYRAGQSESALPAEPIVGDGIYATHILDQLHTCMKVLIDKTSPDAGRETDVSDDQNRAIRLCWLFHLVGDIHQPLHVGTLVDEARFPGAAHSDLGGNLVIIRTHIGAPPYKLHAFWDDRLGTDSHFPTVCDLTELLTHDPRLSTQQLGELQQRRDFRSWAEESYQLAKYVAYRNGELPVAKFDDFDRRLIKADDVPVLPQGVEAEANRVARRRVLVAGYRLAEKLKQLTAGWNHQAPGAP